MIPSATGPGGPRDARVVTGDEAFLGSEDGIEFWRGVDSAEEGTQAFLARARCATTLKRRTPSARRKARSCVVVGYFASPPSASSARLKRLFQSGRRMV